jgi:hypothetical protein
MQVHESQRWRRQRCDWLRAVVSLSCGEAECAVQECAVQECAVQPVPYPDGDGDPARSALLPALLQDARMKGVDDGEGRPKRYLSWFGGRVACML